ncbi:hypothetical protein NFI96_034301 [Prochilodus magdalenae]|nr:hypothetical protein NFI96_034301 [Prochilodus magdalenae]
MDLKVLLLVLCITFTSVQVCSELICFLRVNWFQSQVPFQNAAFKLPASLFPYCRRWRSLRSKIGMEPVRSMPWCEF